MADALRLELSPWKIPVSVLIIGSVQTPIWEKAAQTAGSIVKKLPPESVALYRDQQTRAGVFYRQVGERGMPVSVVVKAVQRLLKQERPKEYVIIGSYAWLAELMLKLLPIRWRDWVVKKQMGLS
jgi:short-subunit dehydrogenase